MNLVLFGDHPEAEDAETWIRTELAWVRRLPNRMESVQFVESSAWMLPCLLVLFLFPRARVCPQGHGVALAVPRARRLAKHATVELRT